MRNKSGIALLFTLFLVLFSSGVMQAQGDRTIRIFADSQTLTIVVMGNKPVSLKDLGFKIVDNNLSKTIFLNIFTPLLVDNLAPGTCLRFSITNGAEVIAPPSECHKESTVKIKVNASDNFWYDTEQGQPKALVVVLGNDLLKTCGNVVPRCDVTIPIPPTATPTPSPTSGPTLPPPTDQIVFLSDRTQQKNDIYLMDADGENVKNLSNTLDAAEFRPSWSPDGNRIAFHSDVNPDFPQIYVLDVNTSEIYNATNSYVYSFVPAWSPDGTNIAFVSFPDGKGDIFTIAPNGSNSRQVTHMQRNGCAIDNPAWSPDSKTIAFSSDCEGNNDIYLVDVATGTVTAITSSQFGEMLPAWSPDGEHIAFVTDRDGNAEIYVMDADGSNLHNISNNPAEDYFPDWSPDGTRIVFNSLRDNNWDIFVMDAGGGNLKRITSDPATDYMPAWRPRPKT